MRVSIRGLLLLGAAGFLLAGCGKGQSTEGLVAALVNDKVISFAEVRKVTEQFQKQNLPPDPKAKGTGPTEQLYYTALERLIEQELILQHAIKSGVQVTDEEVATRVEELKGMAGGEERFQQILAENNATMDDVLRDMKSNLIVQEFVDQRRNELSTVTDEEVRSYYDAHTDEFGPKPQAHAQHILISATPDMSPDEKAKAKDRAEALAAQAKKGADFEDLAAKNSQDPSAAQNRGDLGWFPRGMMVPPFDAAVFAMKPGEISDIVETQFGYHVIKLLELGQTEGMPYEQVASGIRSRLGEEGLQTRFRAVVDSLRAAADVEIKEIPADSLTAIGS
jgi:peptidyl-prolyl cis-trans isomerase C